MNEIWIIDPPETSSEEDWFAFIDDMIEGNVPQSEWVPLLPDAIVKDNFRVLEDVGHPFHGNQWTSGNFGMPPISEDPPPGKKYYYHATPTKNLPSILEHGLRKNPDNQQSAVSLTPHLEAAYTWSGLIGSKENALLRMRRGAVRRPMFSEDEGDEYDPMDEGAELATYSPVATSELEVYQDGKWQKLLRNLETLRTCYEDVGHPFHGNQWTSGEAGVSKSAVVIRPGQKFDMSAIRNRRFMFDPKTGFIILGKENTSTTKWYGKHEDPPDPSIVSDGQEASHGEAFDNALGITYDDDGEMIYPEHRTDAPQDYDSYALRGQFKGKTNYNPAGEIQIDTGSSNTIVLSDHVTELISRMVGNGATEETFVRTTQPLIGWKYNGQTIGKAWPELFKKNRRHLGDATGHEFYGNQWTDTKPTPDNFEEFEQQALQNAFATSRTMLGTYDSSSGEAKPKSAVTDGDELVAISVRNYKSTLDRVWKDKDADFDAVKVRELLDDVGYLTTRGSLHIEAPVERTFESPYYIPLSEVPARLNSFSEELAERLTNKKDAVATAAFVEQELNNIHPWNDGVGRSTRAISAMILARGGQPLPKYPVTGKDYFKHINDSPQEWERFYRTLIPGLRTASVYVGRFGIGNGNNQYQQDNPTKGRERGERVSPHSKRTVSDKDLLRMIREHGATTHLRGHTVLDAVSKMTVADRIALMDTFFKRQDEGLFYNRNSYTDKTLTKEYDAFRAQAREGDWDGAKILKEGLNRGLFSLTKTGDFTYDALNSYPWSASKLLSGLDPDERDAMENGLINVLGEGRSFSVGLDDFKAAGWTKPELERFADRLQDKGASYAGWAKDDHKYSGRDSIAGDLAPFSKDYENFRAATFAGWAMMSNTQEARTLRRASEEVFPNPDGTPFFQIKDRDFYPEDQRRRAELETFYSPRYLDNIRKLKAETEEFYDKKLKGNLDRTLELKRGIGGHPEAYTPGSVESWSSDKWTAIRFGKLMSRDDKWAELRTKVTYKDVLWSYESAANKPGWPPDKELKGKKEFVILGRVVKNVELQKH